MPAYYDEKTKSWYCKFYYTDYTGTKKQKKKRGFKLQREAKEWERNFLETQQANLSMNFENFVTIYNGDMKHRLREHTFIQKQYVINKKLLPFFGKMAVSEITPAHVRKWQNSLIAYRDDKGNPYSATYLRTINNQLAAIMNYAVRYYNLKDNPCRKAGTIGKDHADGMDFWTTEEFNLFLGKVSDKPPAYAGFLTLYYTGLRIGELLALEYGDIDFENCTLSVSKSYQHLNGKDVITPPKTPKSIRTVSIPEFLRDELKSYTERLYGIHKHDRIFPYTKHFFEHEMIRGTKDGQVKRIRLHDIRHSHASLLISKLGVQPKLVSERLGHEKIQTTLDTYSHLYPDQSRNLADQLNGLVDGWEEEGGNNIVGKA